MSKIGIMLAGLFIGHFGHALVAAQMKVGLIQTPSHLQFQVRIQNSGEEALHYRLSNLAHIESLQNLEVKTDADGTHALSILPKSQAEIDYRIAYLDSTPEFYLTTENSWLPSRTDPSGEQSYTFQETLLPGYQMITSATGKDQDEVAAVLCRCHLYQSPDQRLRVYLFAEEPELAKTLLDNLQNYLQRFEKDFGPYPYDQFSVVESSDEVGYAFPKMTWIGSQLLHFPFILKTSLPHELLHSWWGNGVLVDTKAGNWCEGLTTFGADYGLLDEKERKIYRLKALTSYLDYVKSGQEIPLSQFISRGEDRSLQAVGYDKAMMVFVMLEQLVGENVFHQSLRQFYQEFKYQKASFEDLFQVLSKVSGKDFTAFKKFWLYSTGILPADLVQGVWQTSPGDSGGVAWKSLTEALQPLPGMPLSLAFQGKNGEVQALGLTVDGKGQGLEQDFTPLPEKPLAYAFDPDFLLFRQLQEAEKPQTFSQVFAASSALVLSSEPKYFTALKQVLLSVHLQAVTAENLDLTREQTLLVTVEDLGKIKGLAEDLRDRHISFGAQAGSLFGQEYPLADHGFFIMTRLQRTRIVVISLGETLPLERWLQRWLHYGAKGYLVLNATGAEIQGSWQQPFWQGL